ncbi:MAG: efflux RND transporter periplasmic adaptor subunit [Alphaproteobacteria bacterium]|nr:efflux RND transporter periplasmic adaptor subunit [Alphaproteobacteria bacterium]
MMNGRLPMLKLVSVLGLLAAGTALVVPLDGQSADPDQASGSATHSETYRLTAADRRVMIERVPATGTIQPVALVSVSSQTSGQVKEIYADFNDLVKKGDPLALIDPLSFEIAVDMAEAELDIARASVHAQESTIQRMQTDLVSLEFDRDAAAATVDQARALVGDARAELDRKRALGTAASGADRQKAETVLATAEAQLRGALASVSSREAAVHSGQSSLRAAEAQLDTLKGAVRQRDAALRQATAELDRTVIRAPVDGSVTVRSVETGQSVAVSLQAPVLFTIAQDQREMQVMATVSEADIGRIRLGQPFEFSVDAYPDRRFAGEVLQIRVQPQSMQNVVAYTVVASAPNPDLLLLPGMTATSSIITAQTEPVLAVPSAALRFRPPGESRQGSPMLYVLRDGAPAAVPVEPGISDGGYSQIRGGDLAEGAQVITGLADMRRTAPDVARSGLLGFLQ